MSDVIQIRGSEVRAETWKETVSHGEKVRVEVLWAVTHAKARLDSTAEMLLWLDIGTFGKGQLGPRGDSDTVVKGGGGVRRRPSAAGAAGGRRGA